MSIERLDFDRIEESDLNALIDGQVPEGNRLEYKAQTYTSDPDKEEFAKDVAGLANSQGGHLIIGIRAPNGWAEAIVGFDTTAIDDEIQRLQQIADTRIEPRVPSLRIRGVRLADSSSVIVLRVPRSWRPPHRVTARNRFRYYVRRSGQTTEADLEELRAMFTGSAAAIDQAQRWHESRIRQLRLGTAAVPPLPKFAVVTHLIPIASLSGAILADPRTIMESPHFFRPAGTTLDNPTYNLDGFINGRNGDKGYTQVFRNGTVESVMSDLVAERNQQHSMSALRLEGGLVESVLRYFSGLAEAGVPPPIVVQISLVGVMDVEYVITNGSYDAWHQKFPCDDVSLPIGILEDYGDKAHSLRSVRPALDALWNMVGRPESEWFDDEGNWDRPR